MANHRGISEPHVLLASSNPKKLLRNLASVLNAPELDKIELAVKSEVISLFNLGLEHYHFAFSIPTSEWRQNVSRLYYAAYNIKRAVTLWDSGAFSTDSVDHSKIDQLPDSLDNVHVYRTRLKNLRDDRNLSDYSHLANEADLLYTVQSTRTLVSGFKVDSENFLKKDGIIL